MPAQPADPVARVRAYYERNTRLFLALGLGREARAIHRAVWAEGAATYEQALGYVNRQVLIAAERHRPPDPRPLRVVDLGCGVGGTLLFLARALPGPLQALGLSISRSQVRLAARLARRQGLHPRCSFAEADFTSAPLPQAFDLAVAVESLVHAPDPAEVLRQAAAALRPGGALLVCDDLLAEPAPRGAPAAWVEAFRRGWHAPGLRTLPELAALAERAGLRLAEQRDLTPHLRLLRLPDALAGALIRLLELAPPAWLFTRSLAGGLALQHCLRRGVIRYYLLRFERRAPA